MLNQQKVEADTMANSAFSRIVLKLAGVYNLGFGLLIVLFPSLVFQLAGMELPRYPQIWQCVGMVVGVYGIGYLIAARNPTRHWPIVLVGLLGKVFGPIGFLSSAFQGDLPWSWGGIILLNDLIWWFPFGMILFEALKVNSDMSIAEPYGMTDAIALIPSTGGKTLTEMSHAAPVMVVFLRHFGCTFCKEALRDLAETREQIEDFGVSIALVHMSNPEYASNVMQRHGLQEMDHFCDPSCELYRAFDIERGSFQQLFGPGVVWRGMTAAVSGTLPGKLAGDGFRMPAVFLIHKGEIIGSFRHRTAADRPDYVDLAMRFRTTLENEADALST